MKNKIEIQKFLISLEMDMHNLQSNVDAVLRHELGKINPTVVIVDSAYSHIDGKFTFEVRRPIKDLVDFDNTPLLEVYCQISGTNLNVRTEIKIGKPFVFYTYDIEKVLNSDEVKPELLELRRMGKLKKFYMNRLMIIEGIEKFDKYDIKSGDIYVHKKNRKDIIEIVKVAKSSISYVNDGVGIVHKTLKVKFLNWAGVIKDHYEKDVSKMRRKKIEEILA